MDIGNDMNDMRVDFEEVADLEHEIIALCGDASSWDVVFEAIKRTLTFQMANLCPKCRKNVAAHFRRKLPAMANQAGQFAAHWAQQTGSDNFGCH